MADSTLHVENLNGLIRAFRRADKEEAKLLIRELKLAAQPVATATQGRALGHIGRMPLSPQWAVMRLGQSRSVVYMVPKQKGRMSKENPRKRRPNLKRLLLREMEAALAEHASQVEQRVEHVLETVGRKWEQA